MSNIIKIVPPILTQIKDGQSWVTGTNSIVFEKPYEDLEYAFEAHAPGVVVTVVPGSKALTGLSITVSADTNSGYYEANGRVSDYSSALFYSGVDTKILTGSQTLSEGENIVLLPDNGFGNTSYKVIVEEGDVHAYVKPGSKTKTQFIVVSADTNIYFEYTGIGVA